MQRSLEQQLIETVADRGPMPFEQYVELALYDADQGFYAVHGQAGRRRGDFVTSAEVGPLFAAIIADWLDTRWIEHDRPQPFRVAEVGAGVGTLFRGIHRAAPQCFDALTYTLVESSAAMQVAHQSLPSTSWRSSTTLPDEHQHVILANELLDNLAFGIAERINGGWAPVRVHLENGALALAAALTDDSLQHLGALAPAASVGTRVPVASAASDWVTTARSRTNRLLVFDYAATTAVLAERGQAGWLRTYAGHQRGSDPLAHIGLCDITHDVPVDQLPRPDRTSAQAEWLRRHGLPARVEAARQTWQERAHIGDLQAMAARSAVTEAQALVDPDGLGSFLVLEWDGADPAGD